MKSATKSLIDVNKLLSSPTLTLIRDGTDAGDGIPLALHLIRSIVNLPDVPLDSSRFLFLATRSRVEFVKSQTQSDSHIYPHISRDVMTSLSCCKAIDPYTHPNLTQCFDNNNSIEAQSSAISSMLKLLTPHFNFHVDTNAPINTSHNPRVLVIECLHSLSFCFSVDPVAFIHAAMSPPFNLAIVTTAPTNCGIDRNIANLSALAHNLFDMNDLKTGVAVDIDGLLTISKRNGHWTRQQTKPLRYKIAATSFNIVQQQS